MTSETEPSSFWTLNRLRKHWALVLACLIVGASMGLVAGLLKSPEYTAESRLAVGSGAMSDLNIPGFPTASMEMASNYARWVDANGIAGFELPAGTQSVSASPFPESNVIRLEATASTRSTALGAVRELSKQLMTEVNAVADANDTRDLLRRVADRSEAAAEAQLRRDAIRADLNAAQAAGPDSAVVVSVRQQYLRATAEATQAQLVLDGLQDRYRRLVSTNSTEAELTPVGSGSILTSNSRSSTAQRFAFLGLGAGFVVAIIAMRVLDRGRRSPDG